MTEDPVNESPMTAAIVEQFEWHWRDLLRPRLEGLTDAELFWDPTSGGRPAWTVHSAAEQRTAHQAGAGELVIDFDLVDEQPQPFTTIAWRLGGLRSVDDARMQQPCGPAEGPWGDRPFVDLALHINRELIHHLAEVSLLRDLHAHRG